MNFEPRILYEQDAVNRSQRAYEDPEHLLVPVWIRGTAKSLMFEKKALPKLPLKKFGEVWHIGWEIPTTYCIDSEDTCFKDCAHSGPLEPVSVDEMLSLGHDDEHLRSDMRKILGLKPSLPGWMSQALSAGWTPPATWNRGDYG